MIQNAICSIIKTSCLLALHFGSTTPYNHIIPRIHSFHILAVVNPRCSRYFMSNTYPETMKFSFSSSLPTVEPMQVITHLNTNLLSKTYRIVSSTHFINCLTNYNMKVRSSVSW